MPYSITYLAVVLLTYLGLDNAEQVIDAVFIILGAIIALYGRYRANGIKWYGLRE